MSSCFELDSFDLDFFHTELSLWYRSCGRKDLPWRLLAQHADTSSQASIQQALKRNPNIPYLVYISEIMLQQTRISFVLPYFFKFIEQFPTLEHLASGDENQILALWAGLGYYSRARNLMHTARICAQKCKQEKTFVTLPDDRKELRSLKGIGDYTSGAIACFGFGKSESFWDGNIKRVLSRLFAIPTASKAQLDFLSKALLNHKNPHEYNQALLDLGAMICIKLPRCNICPLYSICKAKTSPTSYDIRVKPNYINVTLHLLILKLGTQFALFKDSRYGSLYAPLELACQMDGDAQNIFKPHLYGDLEKLEKIGIFKHTRTIYKITIHLYTAQTTQLSDFKNTIGFDKLEWVDEKAPLCSIAKKSIKLFHQNYDQ